MERRLIVEQFDPDRPQPGGIDTCIRGLVRYCPPGIHIRIAGVDAVGDKRLGVWAEHDIGGRAVEFMPVARLDPSNIKRSRPHSGWVAYGLSRYRPAKYSDSINTHRLNLGAVAMKLYPDAALVQYLHGTGIDDLKLGSDSLFRHAFPLYRMLERYVVPRCADTVVFNMDGAQRLRRMSDRVRFSPNWYDPKQFFPAESEPTDKTKLLWASRIEPQKNPDLAIAVMAALPERYTLTVAGSGALAPHMQKLAAKFAVDHRVKFVGPIPKDRMGAFMREHHLLLMTSLFEGFPYTVVEALASGLPVVTTPGGEPNGLVQHGVNGARVVSDSPELFIEAIDVASRVSQSTARRSVSHLAADVLVPEVLKLA